MAAATSRVSVRSTPAVPSPPAPDATAGRAARSRSSRSSWTSRSRTSPSSNQKVDLATIQAYLEQANVAKPFWPERVETIAELPHTASGKVQRFVLKQIAAKYAIA